MKIACLQFEPLHGNIAGSIIKVDYLLRDLHPGDVDFLLLPELAFAGYSFPSLKAITPHLEACESGPTGTWARNTAQHLNCIVSVGYAETTSHYHVVQDRQTNFNSNVTFGPDGALVAHYRKHFLYVADEPWCIEGKERFYVGQYPKPVNRRVALGICMDINPYRFIAPWDEMEFGNHARYSDADLVVVCMAWSSHTLLRKDVLEDASKRVPDYETISYWISRFTPLLTAEKCVILVMGNRCGFEEDNVYTGTSMVARVGRGKFEVWDVCGKGEERLLIIDTDTEPGLIWDNNTEKLQPNLPI